MSHVFKRYDYSFGANDLPWESPEGEWVKAEDALNREASQSGALRAQETIVRVLHAQLNTTRTQWVRYAAHSVTLNRVTWDMAEHTGQVPAGAEKADLDPETVWKEALRVTSRKANDDAIERCARLVMARYSNKRLALEMTKHMADGERAKALNEGLRL